MTACYLWNRMAIKLDGKSLKEAFISCKPLIRHLWIFSYITYADIPFVIRAKLELIAYKTILIRYMLTLRQYRLYDLVAKLFIVSLNLKFKEDEF
jgi:hypothetical protein